jgi:hypothetical protein
VFFSKKIQIRDGTGIPQAGCQVSVFQS